MISVQGVTHRYAGASENALDQLDVSIERGDLYGLLGPNGAGKSTLISLMTGLRKPQAGDVYYGSVPISRQRTELQQKLAWVPQEYAFYPSLTVQENLLFFAQVRKLGKSAIAARVAEAARITGLEQVMKKRAETFSGGLKRRLNVAIALLGNPDYLFLDEPTVGIDPQSRHFILEAIRQINAAGTTVVYSSHYMEEVQTLCNQIGIIDHGRLLKSGSLHQLLGEQQTGIARVQLSQVLPTGFNLPPNVQLSDDRRALTSEMVSQDEFCQLLASLSNHQIAIERLNFGLDNLEELFLQLTHRSLRD